MLIDFSLFCGCQFRRVEEQDDQSEAIRDAMSLEHIVGQAAPGTLRKRKRLIESITSDEVGPSDFKKVRLMCSQRQNHMPRMENRPKLEHQHAVMQQAGLEMPWLPQEHALERTSPRSSAPILFSETSSQIWVGQDSSPYLAGSSSESFTPHRGLGSPDWNSDSGLQGEQPLSSRNFTHLAQQYDNSVLSKIGTVHDKAQPAKREGTLTGGIATDNSYGGWKGDGRPQQNPPSLSNTRYPHVPPPHPAPKFGNESSIEPDWQWLSLGSDQDSWLDEFDSCSNEFDLQYPGRSSFPIWGVDERVAY